jgi:hypothetical protein
MILRKASELRKYDDVIYQGKKNTIQKILSGSHGWIMVFFLDDEDYKINLHVDDMVEIHVKQVFHKLV